MAGGGGGRGAELGPPGQTGWAGRAGAAAAEGPRVRLSLSQTWEALTPWEDVPAGKRHGLRVAIAAAECVIECRQRVTVNQREVLLLSP